MNSTYTSINEEGMSEDQPSRPVQFHPDPHSSSYDHTSSGSHHHAAQSLSTDQQDSGPATAITFSDDTNKSPPSYPMDSPVSPPRTGGKQALSQFRAIANQAVAARRLSYLHHLAVEDLLHVPQRTKVDVYPKHTYIACTLLTLMETTEDGGLRQVDPLKSPVGIDPDMLSQRIPLEHLDHFKYQYPVSERGTSVLKAQMEQVTMFLLPDGTFITIFQVSGASVVNPIAERLTHDYSIVRKQGDASFLLQSVMDGIVDHAIPITDAFRQEINDLETHVLALPRMKFTKELHHMTAQLSLLKRTLAPTQALVHALRGNDARSPLTTISKTYMGDVMDHCNTMVEDIELMLALCEKLIDLIFNIIAYDTNESMRMLAIVSIIFLPITFVAGVYGTNFEDFPELKHNISYFWIICGIVTAALVIMFILDWLKNKFKAAVVEKRLRRRQSVSIGHKSQWAFIMATVLERYKALPQKTKNYIQLGAMASALGGFYFRNTIREKMHLTDRTAMGSAKRNAREVSQDISQAAK
ncbi:hypothetical protein BGX29_008425 [Mortierella sp. GBA35]|nr:hypothetical protein BGX29_008425 [Mortierella sp. GBA35]